MKCTCLILLAHEHKLRNCELNYVESSVIDRKIRNVAKLQRDTCEKELSGTSG